MHYVQQASHQVLQNARPKHHKIVALESKYFDIPDFEFKDATYELSAYHDVHPSDIPLLIKDATILIVCTPSLTAEILSAETCPDLRYIVASVSGTDTIDIDACRRRGIVVSNCSRASAISVSEHAIALYFALRRRLLQTHLQAQTGAWDKPGGNMQLMADHTGSLPISCAQEVLGIIGYGSIGRHIERIAQLLGMETLVAERKGMHDNARSGRIPFEQVLQASTVVVVTVPKTRATLNLIAMPEIKRMRSEALLINVSRGGIVNEAALMDALKREVIGGAASDVFECEPCGPGTGPLFDAEGSSRLNLITTPHTAWLGLSSQERQRHIMKNNVESWHAGCPINVVKVDGTDSDVA